jgi:alpha-1,6-mannosyltransferase
MANAETIPMGVERGIFSPQLRSPEIRSAALQALGLDPSATLLVAVGRFSGEKRWEMVLRSVAECARVRSVGLILAGDGPRRARLEIMAERLGGIAIMPRLDRPELATLLASADALVHACEAETFCLVAAEARASGIPLIVPDRGAAVDQLIADAGLVFTSGSERSLERAILRFVDRGPELQRAKAARGSGVRSMDEHFAELFARYERLAPALQPAAGSFQGGETAAIPQLALARSIAPTR